MKSTDKTVQTEVSSTQELPPTVAKVDKQVPAVQGKNVFGTGYFDKYIQWNGEKAS